MWTCYLCLLSARIKNNRELLPNECNKEVFFIWNFRMVKWARKIKIKQQTTHLYLFDMHKKQNAIYFLKLNDDRLSFERFRISMKLDMHAEHQ